VSRPGRSLWPEIRPRLPLSVDSRADRLLLQHTAEKGRPVGLMRRDVDAQPAAGSVDDDAPARRYFENAGIPDLERVVSAVPVWVAASAVDRESPCTKA
jgi:hypothetical protein